MGGYPRRFRPCRSFGAHVPPGHAFRDEAKRTAWARDWTQSYLRLAPERHEVLRGFGETDLLAYGGMLEPLIIDPGAIVPLTFVPPLPVAPVESVWMREPKTTVAGLVLRETAGGGRVAYLPADLDRRFSRENLPDHGDLLASLVRWAVKDDLPLRVEGRGLIDCQLYRQPGRLVLHLVNLTSAGTWRTPVHELIPIGPFRVAVRLPAGVKGCVTSLVSGRELQATAAERLGSVRNRHDHGPRGGRADVVGGGGPMRECVHQIEAITFNANQVCLCFLWIEPRAHARISRCCGFRRAPVGARRDRPDLWRRQRRPHG